MATFYSKCARALTFENFYLKYAKKELRATANLPKYCPNQPVISVSKGGSRSFILVRLWLIVTWHKHARPPRDGRVDDICVLHDTLLAHKYCSKDCS